MEDIPKHIQYASTLAAAVSQVFNEESEFYIDYEELNEGDNLTHFIHALANVMPTKLYNQLIVDDKNYIDFNHLANKLCFQYAEK